MSLLEVPYSEHSSYSELRRFVKFLRVKEASQVVATVNRRQAKEMEGMVRGWIEERRREGPDSQPLAGQGKAQVLVQGKVQGKVQVQKRQSGERMEAPCMAPIFISRVFVGLQYLPSSTLKKNIKKAHTSWRISTSCR